MLIMGDINYVDSKLNMFEANASQSIYDTSKICTPTYDSELCVKYFDQYYTAIMIQRKGQHYAY